MIIKIVFSMTKNSEELWTWSEVGNMKYSQKLSTRSPYQVKMTNESFFQIE